MRRVGRSFLFILSFLSLQLTLISGGEQCPVIIGAQSGTAMQAVDMAVTAMPGMDMTRPQDGGNPSDHDASHDDEQSCDEDSEGASCDSMTVCVFAAVITPVGVDNPQRVPSVRAPTLAMRTPPTEGAAPDLPPPRLRS